MTAILPHGKPINLLRGWPSTTLLPAAQLASAAHIALSDPEISDFGLLYGPDEGYGPLREAISTWSSSFYSVTDDPSRICITGGASQNLACALQVFTDPAVTRAIWIVAPCYFLACRIFEDAGFAGRLRAVGEDDEGLDVNFLEREMEKLNKDSRTEPKFRASRPWTKFYDHIIYAVPTFSNPSGKTMSLQRRQELVHLARKYNALIITDDVYDMLQWPNNLKSDEHPHAPLRALLPRLSDIDRNIQPLASDPKHFGHTMSNHSFSKILGPGLRTGWTDSSPALSYALSQCGSSRSGGCASQMTATIITQLVVIGELDNHIRSTLIPAYQKRWSLMMDAIEKELVPLGVTVSRNSLKGKAIAGGYFVWLHLPNGLRGTVIAAKAKETEQLVVAPGPLFAVYGDEKSVALDEFIRLCFSWVYESDLVLGVQRLGRVIKTTLEAKVQDRINNGEDYDFKEKDLSLFR